MEIVRETHAAWQNLVLGNQIIMITIIMIIILTLILILIIIILLINKGKKDVEICSDISSNDETQNQKSQKVRATDLPNNSNIVKNLSFPKLSIDDLLSVEPFSPIIKNINNNNNNDDTYSNISDKSGHEENKAPSF
jgi:hypothetical protein